MSYELYLPPEPPKPYRDPKTGRFVKGMTLRKKSWCLSNPAPDNYWRDSRYRKEINYIEGVVHPRFIN